MVGRLREAEIAGIVPSTERDAKYEMRFGYGDQAKRTEFRSTVKLRIFRQDCGSLTICTICAFFRRRRNGDFVHGQAECSQPMPQRRSVQPQQFAGLPLVAVRVLK